MNVSRLDIATLQCSCENIDTPRSLCVYLMMKYGEYKSYLELEINPEHYDSAYLFGLDYFVTKFLSKWKGFKIKGLDPKQVAIGDWLSAEAKNVTTNARLKRHSSNPLTTEGLSVEPILFLAQRKVRDILGSAPTFRQLASHCDWSKGSTFDLRLGTHFTNKMTSKMTVTDTAFKYISSIVGHDPGWCESIDLKIDGPVSLLPECFTFVKGNKLTTVPKSAKTDRCISIEPTANIYLQKSVGSIIRRRLKRFGVDLDDQTKNQLLAQIAIINDFCTVDLSSASDTITIELVKSLLPLDWYFLLDDLRSKETLYEDTWLRSHKFSSMGNGFTFELESLIFYALASAVSESLSVPNPTVSVYGDDIIIDREAYKQLRQVFDFCGFKVNEKKSFSSGRFFESCGSHFFDGQLVTPAYQKNVSDKREEVIRLYNRVFRWTERLIGVPEVFGNVFHLIIKRFKSLFKDPYVPRIPRYAVDDRGFLSSLDLLRFSFSHDGYICRVYSVTQRYRDAEQAAFYAYKLRKSELYNDSDQVKERWVKPILLSSDSQGRGKYGTDGGYRYTTARFPAIR